MRRGEGTWCQLALMLITSVATPTSLFADSAQLNGVTIDFLVVGEGPPVYLLHGGMESRDTFELLIQELASSFTVVAPDSREQGRSGSSDLQITYELMALDLLSLSQYLGHDRISIVGLSDGGITALNFATEHPERIRKLVLLGAVFHYEAYSPETREFIASFEWDGNRDPKSYPGQFIKHYLLGRKNLSDFAATLREMSTMWTTSPNLESDDLARIKSETLVVNGDRNDVPLRHALALYEALPNASLFVVPGGGHYSLTEKPELVNPVIQEFLRSLNARAGHTASTP